MKRLAIIGAASLGRQLAHHAIHGCGYEVVGFFDDGLTFQSPIDGFPFLGPTSAIVEAFSKKKFDGLTLGIGYRNFDIRRDVFEKFRGQVPFLNLIHRQSLIDPTVQLGEGIVTFPGVILDKNVRVENNVLFNLGVIVAHDSVIGAHSYIAPGVKIAGEVQVGSECFLGVGTTIIDGVSLGSRVQTGGGAVVTESLPKSGLYLGVPAKLRQPQI